MNEFELMKLAEDLFYDEEKDFCPICVNREKCEEKDCCDWWFLDFHKEFVDIKVAEEYFRRTPQHKGRTSSKLSTNRRGSGR